MMHWSWLRAQPRLPQRLIHLVLAVVLLNAPFWLLATHAFMARAVISFDSLIALLIAQFSRKLGLLAIAACWIFDLTTNTAFSYHFASPIDFIRSFTFASRLDWSAFFKATALVSILPFAAAAYALRVVSVENIKAWPIASTIVALLLLDTVNGSSEMSRRQVRLMPGNLAGSSLYAIARAAINEDRNQDLVATQAGGGTAEFDALLPAAKSTDSSVLYVIVESFGEHKDPAVQEWLRQQLFPVEAAAHYTLIQTTVAASGGTTSGELRRLCGLQGSYRRLHTAVGAVCLPQRYARAGWHTVGMHGFSEHMFERIAWWPALGLEDMWFGEQLQETYRNNCGAAFRGICDQDLIENAVNATKIPHTFVYALTLNTHLPLALMDIPSNLAPVCRQANTGKDVCVLLARLGVTLRALATKLAALPGGKPFVLVTGDHAPPFSETYSRDQFIREAVPMFALTPQSAAPMMIAPIAQPR